MTGRPRVLLICQRTTLPWIFEAADEAGVQMTLIPRPDEDIGAADLPPVVTDVLTLDPFGRPDDALDQIEHYHRRRPFAAAVTLYDPAVGFTARVTAQLGLSGLSPDAADVCRDKGRARQALAAHGCRGPAFAVLDDPADWPAAAGLRFPVVVKPAGGYSSVGVTRVDDPAALAAAVRQVWRIADELLASPGALIVEEYLDGPEFAVESLAFRGQVKVLTIGDKGEPIGPYFEEGIYRAPSVLSGHVAKAIVTEVTAAHVALGLTDGPTHTELRLVGGTEPYVLEIGARIGGSGVSHHIVAGVTGIRYAADALRVALGREPECFSGPVAVRGAAANYIVPCGGTGEIAAIHGLAELDRDDRVDLVVQMLFAGDVVLPYPDFSGYPAFVLSTHRDPADAERFHDELATGIRVEYADG